jgi:hypothetical protein
MLSWSFRKTAAPSTIHNKNIVSTFSGEPDSQACGPQRPIQRFPPRLFATTERLQTKMRYTIVVLQPRLNMAWIGTSSKRSDTHPERNASGSLLLNEPGSLWCLGYGLDDRAIDNRSRQRRKDFCSSLRVQTGSGSHPPSWPMGTGDPFPGAKARPGRDADHSPSSRTGDENEELYLLSSPSAFVACSRTALAFSLLLNIPQERMAQLDGHQ